MQRRPELFCGEGYRCKYLILKYFHILESFSSYLLAKSKWSWCELVSATNGAADTWNTNWHVSRSSFTRFVLYINTNSDFNCCITFQKSHPHISTDAGFWTLCVLTFHGHDVREFWETMWPVNSSDNTVTHSKIIFHSPSVHLWWAWARRSWRGFGMLLTCGFNFAL